MKTQELSVQSGVPWLVRALPRSRAGRRAAVAGGYAAALALAAWSAILAKEATFIPPLARVSVVGDQAPRSPAPSPSIEPAEVAHAAPDVDMDSDPGFVPGGAADDELASETGLPGPWGDLVYDPSVRWFNGRAVKPVRTMQMTVTAYSPDARSCGESADGITATLHSVKTNGFRLVAADPKVLSYGSMITVPGYDNDQIVPVLDCGGAIKGRRLDVLFPTHEEARQWGVRKITVVVWGYADGSPIDNPRKLR